MSPQTKLAIEALRESLIEDVSIENARYSEAIGKLNQIERLVS